MAFHGPYHGSVTLTCIPLPNHHPQLSKVVPMRKQHTMKA